MRLYPTQSAAEAVVWAWAELDKNTAINILIRSVYDVTDRVNFVTDRCHCLTVNGRLSKNQAFDGFIPDCHSNLDTTWADIAAMNLQKIMKNLS